MLTDTTRANAIPVEHFNQIELARRWKISPRTLERWRWLKQGPKFLRIGGRVLYRRTDIEAYEAAHLREVPSAKAEPPR